MTNHLHKEKPNTKREVKDEDEFKHLRNEASRKAQVCLKQARRRELNNDAINAITKYVDEDDEWQTDLAFALVKKTGTKPRMRC